MPTELQKEIVKRLRLFNKGGDYGTAYTTQKKLCLIRKRLLLRNHRAAV
jgi:hypothetical protein